MVDDVRLAPLRSLDGAVRSLDHARVQEEEIKLVITKVVKRLLSKRLDALEVGQLQGQECQAVLGGVVLELVEGLLRPCRISCSENEPIGFCLCEELLDQLKSLR